MLYSKLEARLRARGAKFSKKIYQTIAVKQDTAQALENVCRPLDINALKHGVKDVEAMLALFTKRVS